MKTLTSVLALGALTAAMATTPALAATHYTVACLTNNTSFNISYNKRMNGGGWSRTNLAPGETKIYSVKFAKANQNTPLNVMVSFDADGRGTSFTQNTPLVGYASVGQNCREGKRYAFQHEPRDRNFIRIVYLD